MPFDANPQPTKPAPRLPTFTGAVPFTPELMDALCGGSRVELIRKEIRILESGIASAKEMIAMFPEGHEAVRGLRISLERKERSLAKYRQALAEEG